MQTQGINLLSGRAVLSTVNKVSEMGTGLAVLLVARKVRLPACPIVYTKAWCHSVYT